MVTITIDYTIAGKHVVGWARIPSVDFPTTGIVRYLKDQGATNVNIYKPQTGSGIEMVRKKNVDNIVVSALRDNRYYDKSYENVIRAYCAMGPNYQDLLTRPKQAGAMI